MNQVRLGDSKTGLLGGDATKLIRNHLKYFLTIERVYNHKYKNIKKGISTRELLWFMMTISPSIIIANVEINYKTGIKPHEFSRSSNHIISFKKIIISYLNFP